MLQSRRGQVDAYLELPPMAMPVNASTATAIRSGTIEGNDHE